MLAEEEGNVLIFVTVFVCGAAVMGLELAGARVLAPWAGMSLYAWTGLIGVILSSLSVGYWAGGRIADRRPTAGTLSLIVFIAAACIGLSAWLRDAILSALQARFDGYGAIATIGSLILFAPASLFLGMVTPYAVRLRMRDVEKAGTTAGSIYALSSAGSIAGTFMAGFVLIPRLGTGTVLISLAVALGLLSFAISISKISGGRVASLLLLAAFAGQSRWGVPGNLIADVDTRYARAWVYKDVDEGTGKPILVLSTDPWGQESAAFLEGDGLVFECLKYFRLARHFAPDFKRTLMIGGAAYSYPMDYLKNFRDSSIDVVEIDPGLTFLARQYFGLSDDPRMRIIHEDGRMFLNRATARYDVIILDAFIAGACPPHHLVTVEAARRMRGILRDDGAVFINIIGAIEGRDGRFTRALYRTFSDVFPAVYLFPVDRPDDGREVQNIILAASASVKQPALRSGDPELDAYLAHRWTEPIAPDLPIMTDDYAPVEYYLSGVRL